MLEDPHLAWGESAGGYLAHALETKLGTDHVFIEIIPNADHMASQFYAFGNVEKTYRRIAENPKK